MPSCKFCNQDNLEWYQDHQDKWKLGLKLDINNYRPHRCSPPQTKEIKSNKRNWVVFECERCYNKTYQNLKLLLKTNNICLECNV